jgi:hypothetical protein
MIALYDHIQQLRAELRCCGFTRRERAAVQAKLAKAIAEQADLDRAFDTALEALCSADDCGAASGPFFANPVWRPFASRRP